MSYNLRNSLMFALTFVIPDRRESLTPSVPLKLRGMKGGY